MVGSVLVVGGGIAGLRASIDLSRLGHKVQLIERTGRLGGRLNDLDVLAPFMTRAGDVLTDLLTGIEATNVNVMLSSELVSLSKLDVRLSAEVSGPDGTVRSEVDAVIFATGLESVDASQIVEYGHGTLKGVVTSLELEAILKQQREEAGTILKDIGKVVFIQCVGSRTERNGVPYCSSICCTSAIKQALVLRSLGPDIEIHVLYIDIRTAGKGQEALYKEARKKGVRFVRGQPSMVLPGPKGKLKVCGENTLIRELYELEADLVVLCNGLRQSPGNVQLLERLGVKQDMTGFASIIRLPSLTDNEKIFLAGSITGPKNVEDTIAHAYACALQVHEQLMKMERSR